MLEGTVGDMLSTSKDHESKDHESKDHERALKPLTPDKITSPHGRASHGRVDFDFLGVLVSLVTSDQETLHAVEHDFSYFLAPSGKEEESKSLQVEYFPEEPNYDALPEMIGHLLNYIFD